MTHSLRFGIMVLQNLPYPELVEHYQHVEALGYDSAWVADHFVDPYVSDKPWFDGWTILTALAAANAHLRNIFMIFYRNYPLTGLKRLTTRLQVQILGADDTQHLFPELVTEQPPDHAVKRTKEILATIKRSTLGCRSS